MSFCLRPIVCKKCGKPLTLFEGRTCLECDKTEQELIITTAGEGKVTSTVLTALHGRKVPAGSQGLGGISAGSSP